MANTYSQIYIHLVFAVKYRQAQIPLEIASKIHSYMAAVVNNTKKCKAIIVGGYTDHVHLLVRLSTTTNISELVKSVKVATTGFINSEISGILQFAWQEGYGAFSVSAIHSNAVEEYIRNQLEHHSKSRFLDEYENLLIKNGVEYDEDYLFKEME